MARHLRWTALLFLGALCIGSPFELPFGGADIVLGSVYDLVTLDDRASLDPPNSRPLCPIEISVVGATLAFGSFIGDELSEFTADSETSPNGSKCARRDLGLED